jgi:hypothetical protein
VGWPFVHRGQRYDSKISTRPIGGRSSVNAIGRLSVRIRRSLLGRSKPEDIHPPLIIPRVVTAVAALRRESLRMVAEQMAQNAHELWFGKRTEATSSGPPIQSSGNWPQQAIKQLDGWNIAYRNSTPWFLEVHHPGKPSANWSLN